MTGYAPSPYAPGVGEALPEGFYVIAVIVTRAEFLTLGHLAQSLSSRLRSAALRNAAGLPSNPRGLVKALAAQRAERP